MKYKRLGEMLTDAKLITEEQLMDALALQRGTGKRLGTVLIEHKFITEADLIEMLRIQLGIEFIDLADTKIDPELVNVIPKNIVKKYGIIPVRLEKDVLYLAMEDPLNFMAVEEARVVSKKKIIPMIATAAGVNRAYNILYENEGAVKAMVEMRQEGTFAEIVDIYTKEVINTLSVGNEIFLFSHRKPKAFSIQMSSHGIKYSVELN